MTRERLYAPPSTSNVRRSGTGSREVCSAGRNSIHAIGACCRRNARSAPDLLLDLAAELDLERLTILGDAATGFPQASGARRPCNGAVAGQLFGECMAGLTVQVTRQCEPSGELGAAGLRVGP